MVHDMMKKVYMSDRRMAAIAELDVTLTGADKESIAATLTEKGTEKGMSAAELKALIAKVAIPDTMKVGL